MNLPSVSCSVVTSRPNAHASRATDRKSSDRKSNILASSGVFLTHGTKKWTFNVRILVSAWVSSYKMRENVRRQLHFSFYFCSPAHPVPKQRDTSCVGLGTELEESSPPCWKRETWTDLTALEPRDNSELAEFVSAKLDSLDYRKVWRLGPVCCVPSNLWKTIFLCRAPSHRCLPDSHHSGVIVGCCRQSEPSNRDGGT